MVSGIDVGIYGHYQSVSKLCALLGESQPQVGQPARVWAPIQPRVEPGAERVERPVVRGHGATGEFHRRSKELAAWGPA
jgi:hypothetical protein